jgi:hypothetical protein
MANQLYQLVNSSTFDAMMQSEGISGASTLLLEAEPLAANAPIEQGIPEGPFGNNEQQQPTTTGIFCSVPAAGPR